MRATPRDKDRNMAATKVRRGVAEDILVGAGGTGATPPLSVASEGGSSAAAGACNRLWNSEEQMPCWSELRRPPKAAELDGVRASSEK